MVDIADNSQPEFLLAEATAAREAGNGFFKAAEYAKANERYGAAIALLGRLEGVADDATATAVREAAVKARLNSAACLLKLQGYSAAIAAVNWVIKVEPENAKAHFRLGQALSVMGDLPAAQESLTASIKLNPSLREPREALEALRARIKANPRLEQALQDMSLVEERALRALNTADIKRARAGLELLLKDARANAEAHWEARALLGLALLCQDEGETSGAQDYLDAARRKLTVSDDRRAELYCLQTQALILMDGGQLEKAVEMLEGGRALADEMSERGLAARFGANLATVHSLRGDGAKALPLAEAALAAAKERHDRHFEAVAAIARAHALRLLGRYEECGVQLTTAIAYAESLGYSHVLSAGLRHLAHLQLATGERATIVKALESLRRAHAIAKSNGLLRAACDDACNYYAASLRHGMGPRTLEVYEREEALKGLEKAKDQAASLGYTRAHVELLLALGLGHLRGPHGGWQEDEAELDSAEAHLEKALELVEACSATHAQALGHRCLCHMLRASAARASRAADAPPHSESSKALRCAAEAVAVLEGRAEAKGDGGGADAAALTNLAIAMILAKRPTADSAVDAAAAAAAARTHLEAARRVATDAAERRKASAALVGALETLGDTEGAIAQVLELVETADAAMVPSARLRVDEGHRLREQGELRQALASYKVAFRLASAAA